MTLFVFIWNKKTEEEWLTGLAFCWYSNIRAPFLFSLSGAHFALKCTKQKVNSFEVKFVKTTCLFTSVV